MKSSAILCLSVVAMLLSSARPGEAAPYFPYDSIDKYYGIKPQEQPDSNQPALSQPSQPIQQPQPVPPPRPPVKPFPREGEALALTAPPDFLFPPKLGFGVAVGVSYDMMYLEKRYYAWQDGAWYRSSSYRGPWNEIVVSQLPPELQKQPLAKIREQRNSEFKKYWGSKAKYQGKRFRPGETKEKEEAEH